MTFEERIQRLTALDEELAPTAKRLNETAQRQLEMAEALVREIREERRSRRETD